MSAPGAETAAEPSGVVHRDELARYLGVLLRIDEGSDYGPNGLQVEGAAEIGCLVTGVSACQELFERAAAERADAVLVHHGLFWKGLSPVITGIMARRVRTLIDADLSLFAYHLPLDRHPELGNNALAARAFGLVDVEPFAPHQGLPVGFMGRFPTPLAAEELVHRCQAIYGQAPLAFTDGPPQVRTVGIVSGGAQSDLHAAIGEGLDAFITGEASEWVMNLARENGIHFLAAGHYATERLGVRAVGDHLAERYGIEALFIDVPNPV